MLPLLRILALVFAVWIGGARSPAAALERQAPDTMVLLTSFDPAPSTIPPQIPELMATPLREYLAGRTARIEGLFRNFFRSYPQFHLRVFHLATQEDAWRELHNPRNFGVFWVSHATGPDTNPLLGGAIIDSHGFNIAPIFQGAHPDLRILALIGCGSTQPLIGTRFNRLLDRRTYGDLRISANQESVVAEDALTMALEQTRFAYKDPAAHRRSLALQASLLKQSPPLSARPAMRLSLRIRRVFDMGLCEDYFPALRIMNRRGEVLGVFPASQAMAPRADLRSDGRLEQVLDVELTSLLADSDPFFRPMELDLLVEAGSNATWRAPFFDLGEVTVEGPPHRGHWAVVVNPRTHRPVGRESRLLRYTP